MDSQRMIDPVNDNDVFFLEGPDENGDVWLVCPHSPVETVINLGKHHRVVEVVTTWLSSLERGS